MQKYHVGDQVDGIVSGIQKYGVFVKIDDEYTGLIHISEISSDYVKNINDYVNLNETISVEITEIDEKTKQMKLSIKNINYIKVEPKNAKIEEVGTGFNCLKRMLNKWIDEKITEINQ